MKKYRSIIYVLLFFIISSGISAQNVTISMTEAGTLEQKISSLYSPLNVILLTVSGPLNGTDLRLIRLLANKGRLTTVRMSSAQIVSGGGPYNEAPNGILLYTKDNELGEFLFSNCFNKGGNASVILPTSVTKIGAYLFENCNSLTSVTLPPQISKISDFTFSGCTGLTSVFIPSGVTEIGNGAFLGCAKLTSIELTSAMKEVASFSFSGCAALTSVTIPKGVERIGKSAFSGCPMLRTVTFSDSLQTIESGAFDRCLALQKISLPKSITRIGGYAFDQCFMIVEFECMAVTTPVLSAENVFNGINVTTCTLKIPENSISLYSNALQWKDFTKRVGVVPVGNKEEVISPIQMVRNNQILYISNLTYEGIIRIYSISGFLMHEKKINEGSIEIPLWTYDPVIVQVGNQIFKN